MAQRGSFPVALILLVLILLGATAAIIVRGPMAGMLGLAAPAPQRLATATVITSVPCDSSTPGDLVEVQVNGVREQARLNGCGHTQGEQLRVEVPVKAPRHNLTVQMYTPSAVSSSAGTAPGRLDWVLLTLAVIAGGGYMLLLSWRPNDDVAGEEPGEATVSAGPESPVAQADSAPA